ncbi:MAG: hypothetical protein LBE51_02075 [Acidovorax sp.]|jgi:hypothetical protein|nr:hypothetical protein [Acidovorax sp.]
MEFSGFFKPYEKNRPLKEEERQRQLHQKQRLDVDPVYQLSVIDFNSNYMELVDKWFVSRGAPTSGALILGFFVLFVVGAWPYYYFTEESVGDGFGLAALSITLISLLPMALSIWLFKKDAFRFTYFPIRINRKTRMVHVFRTDGTVLSSSWDDVFFCISELPRNNFEIHGNILNDDGDTVKETFAFMLWGVGVRDLGELLRYWEFVRRYMEEGPESVLNIVEYCLPIKNQRESFAFGFHRMHGESAHVNFIFQIVFLLMYFIFYPGRWIAMHTSKLPIWPQETEEACTIDPDDPFRKDASMNKPIADNLPIYFVAAVGIALLAAWVLW